MEFIDFHAHLHPTHEAMVLLIDRMSRLGISKAVVVAGGLLSPQRLSHQINGESRGVDSPVPNRKILELCEGSDGKLIPFYFSNPIEGAFEYREIGRAFSGLKLGPAVHGVPLVDPRYEAFFHVAQNLEHPVYLHCLSRPGFDVAALTALAQRFSKLVFVMGHAGIGNCDFAAVDTIAPYSNIYFETSGGFSSVVSYAAAKLGISRILFGTEYPLQDPEVELVKIRNLDLSRETLNRNAERLLGGFV